MELRCIACVSTRAWFGIGVSCPIVVADLAQDGVTVAVRIERELPIVLLMTLLITGARGRT